LDRADQQWNLLAPPIAGFLISGASRTGTTS
jgi:hypothetical protein